MKTRLDPISPGEILLEEFLRPMGLSQNELARAIGVPATRVNDIVRGKRGITRDTAARLSVYFGTTCEFWINLQARYDAQIVHRDLLPVIARKVRPRRPSAA